MDKQLILYHTSACHLCELAHSLILPYVQHLQLSLTLVDIVDEDALLNELGQSIPVVEHASSRQRLYWPFDENQFRNFLQQCLSV